jgi:tetratricopeptide (TPR) repeat protein/DNA-binding XRE family transcriptional regulator
MENDMTAEQAPPWKSFGQMLRHHRRASGLSQEELAERARVSTRTISDLERGRAARPYRQTVGSLAAALGMQGPLLDEFVRLSRQSRGPISPGGQMAPTGIRDAPQTASGHPDTLTAPGQLPAAVSHFTGRAAELDALADMLGEASKTKTVVISALAGTAGVGKTALAVHWAHQVAEHFPDGQLYVNLRGYDPGEPVLAADALAGFLRALGVPGRQIPDEADERTQLYRSRLAGRRVLVVLDNARDGEQVRPLLPGNPGCLALVTSRDSLAGLVATDGARRLDLDVLPPGDAVSLLRSLIGPRADEDLQATAQLAGLCARLPLALRIAAELATARRTVPLAELAAELAQNRLDMLDAGEDRADVRAVFSWSIRQLPDGVAEAFALTALHPGEDLDVYATAALTGTTTAQARRVLGRLHRASLVEITRPGRYGMHDLLRAYAREQAADRGADGQCDQALTRLFDYYQQAASAADRLLARHYRGPGGPGTAGPAAAMPELATAADALAWIRAERLALLACLDHVTATGQRRRVVELTAGIATVLLQDGPWAEAVARHAAAADAAGELGDRPARASALLSLGDIQRLMGDSRSAGASLAEAESIFAELCDPLGQAAVLSAVGDLQRLAGDNQAAGRSLDLALGIYRDHGDLLGQAYALYRLGIVRCVTDRLPDAARLLAAAVGLFRRAGDRLGEITAISLLALTQHELGAYPPAIRNLTRSLVIFGELGNRLGQANAYSWRSAVLQVTGDYPAAAGDVTRALDIYRQIGSQNGVADALIIWGRLQCLTGDYTGADSSLAEALAIATRIGNQSIQANALAPLGEVGRLTGRLADAESALTQALTIYHHIGDRSGEAQALNRAGALHRDRGDLPKSRQCHEQALSLARQIAMPLEESRALAGMGRCAGAGGDRKTAITHLRDALTIAQRIGAGDAPALAAELAGHSGLLASSNELADSPDP